MTIRIAVVGNGYVGTVVASCFAAVGHRVVGLESDPGKLATLKSGRAPLFEAGLDALIARGLASKRLRFTDDPAVALAGCEAVFVCVGTPNGAGSRPDLSAAAAAARVVVGALAGPAVLVVKSTMPIGSARWLSSLVEDMRVGRASAGCDVSVVVNPEFLREGSAVDDFFNPDRVVIGSEDREAGDLVAAIYQPILEREARRGCGSRAPVIRTSFATAETIKYAANAFLATKVSFINEVALICERVGAEVTEVATAIGLDLRIGGRFLEAGLGWGGSCFGKDLAALITSARDLGCRPELLEAVASVNKRQRSLVIDKLQRSLATLLGRRIALLGIAFKPGTDDVRDAPALELARELVDRGALVTAYDPVVRRGPGLEEVRLASDPYEAVERADAAVLVTEWPEFVALDLAEINERMRGDVFIDGRNVFDPEVARAAGLRFEGIGRSHTPRRAKLRS